MTVQQHAGHVDTSFDPQPSLQQKQREKKSVLFIGTTPFSNLYTAVDTPAKGRVGLRVPHDARACAPSGMQRELARVLVCVCVCDVSLSLSPLPPCRGSSRVRKSEGETCRQGKDRV